MVQPKGLDGGKGIKGKFRIYAESNRKKMEQLREEEHEEKTVDHRI